RAQRRYSDALRRKRLNPTAVGTKFRPTRPAESQNAGIRFYGNETVRRLQLQSTSVIPSDPPVAQPELNSEIHKLTQPGTKQRRTLEAGREDATATADEGVLSELMAPGACCRWRKTLD